ncbi:hypothetical protein MRX96_020316 [Rhipicephalus microplus]
MVSWLSANTPVFPNSPRVPELVRELQSWSFELPWNPPNPPGNPVLAASRFAWQHPLASTSSVTWPERTQYIPASDAVCSGHNTACHTMLNALLTFQAMVSWLSANAPVFPNPPRVPEPVHELQSWSFELTWNPPNPPGNPVLAASRFAWQQPPASTSLVPWPERTQYIPASDDVCSGHNTACHTMLNALLTFQMDRAKTLLKQLRVWGTHTVGWVAQDITFNLAPEMCGGSGNRLLKMRESI